MCGIAGFLGRPASGAPLDAVRAMTDAIAHRGPDADGHWCDDAAGIALGHRRLSIVDLSPAGAQPMVAASGRYVIVFNGEAYNFAPLRRELAEGGYPFRGHSDTEVLLAAFDRWGVAAAVPRFAGMFAIAVWDRAERLLTLVRDRLGEKPLYFGRVAGAWLFGSELKALRRFPGFACTVDPRAATQLLRYGYVQAPRTIFAELRKVRPGTMVVLADGAEPCEVEYWSAHAAAAAGRRAPLPGSDDDVADALGTLLDEVVRDEMVADVPVGAFLSGGIDSSLVVALMQRHSARPVRTFTIGFDDPRFDEAEHARAVAEHLGTDHTTLTVRGDDVLALVPRLHEYYDEPMADSSQLPTLLVARLTRAHVTVALSGDGGDELFAGYVQHRRPDGVTALRTRAPRWLRRMVGATLDAIPDPPPAALARFVHDRGRRPPNALARFGRMLDAPGGRELYDALRATTQRPAALLSPALRAAAGDGRLDGPWLDDGDEFQSRMLFDAVSYLPDDILVKVDRAAMAASLETRAPLLDHRVFELAWRIPFARKMRDGVGKLPLRTLLYRHVPRALVDRPKRGFAVPLADWLRGPLRPWAESLLEPSALDATGILDGRRVGTLWAQHREGVADHAERLWTVLALADFVRRESGRP